jgi:hypothetical protein
MGATRPYNRLLGQRLKSPDFGKFARTSPQPGVLTAIPGFGELSLDFDRG